MKRWYYFVIGLILSLLYLRSSIVYHFLTKHIFVTPLGERVWADPVFLGNFHLLPRLVLPGIIAGLLAGRFAKEADVNEIFYSITIFVLYILLEILSIKADLSYAARFLKELGRLEVSFYYDWKRFVITIFLFASLWFGIKISNQLKEVAIGRWLFVFGVLCLSWYLSYFLVEGIIQLWTTKTRPETYIYPSHIFEDYFLRISLSPIIVGVISGLLVPRWGSIFCLATATFHYWGWCGCPTITFFQPEVAWFHYFAKASTSVLFALLTSYIFYLFTRRREVLFV